MKEYKDDLFTYLFVLKSKFGSRIVNLLDQRRLVTIGLSHKLFSKHRHYFCLQLDNGARHMPYFEPFKRKKTCY